MSLLLQFKRAANVYFLLITILTIMPFSPKSPESQIGTFAFILIISMLKEAYEDYQRFKSDNELNNKISWIYDYNAKVDRQVKWRDLKTGQICKVLKNEEVPADMLIVSSVTDIIYISTMNLDGETNLKERHLITKQVNEDNLYSFKGKIECDYPDENLEHWDGNVYSD